MNMDRLLWLDRLGRLELVRADRTIVARVQRLDSSRWLSVVFFDAPGGGAASVQPDRGLAIEWVSETVASVFSRGQPPAFVEENQ
jgi:hypothetical protein